MKRQNTEIPINATYHIINAVCEIDRQGEPLRQWAFRNIIYKALPGAGIESTGAPMKPILTRDGTRDKIVEVMSKGPKAMQAFFDDFCPNPINWVEDDFAPKRYFKSNKYTQKEASMMTIRDCVYRGGAPYACVAQAYRDFWPVKDEDAYRTMSYFKKYGHAIVKGKGIQLEHRWPVDWMVHNKLKNIKSIQHLRNTIAKYATEAYWSTPEDNKILNDAGLNKTLPPCGTDRYDYAGLAVY